MEGTTMYDLPIIDTHLHLWDTTKLNYPWLADVPAISDSHLLADFNAQSQGIHVEQMVFLQCDVETAQYRDEAAWITSLAEEDPRITGMVPFAPLEKGEAVRDELESLVAANPLTKGIRRLIQAEPDPAFCVQTDFVKAVRLLGELDLSFDICLRGDAQLAHAIELVKACPGTRFILDHIGKPNIKDKVTEPWSKLIGELAALPNVWCKVSGIVTEADLDAWTADDIRPYILRVIDAFGTDRVIYGGDWPVSRLATTYTQWVETLSDITAGLSAAERRALFHDNAAGFYRLPREV